MSELIEKTILESLVGSEEYTRKAIPFLKEEYFSSRIDKILFNEINRFFAEHNKIPTAKILTLFIEDYTGFKQEEYEEALQLVESFEEPEKNLEWLLSRTEKFVKDKAVFNAITTSIQIMDGKQKEYNVDAIPSLLQDALSISFDKTIGHDYAGDMESRFDYYNLKEDRIPFRIDLLNKVTKGGIPRKTLNMLLAGTGVGKSLFLCDYAAFCIANGFNVLYITMEMAEERIAERIDCNLMDIPIDQLHRLNKLEFESKFNKLKTSLHGKLVIKEYPTSSAHVGHFKSLLEDLRTKKKFKPDVVCVDYLNICASQRYKGGANYSSYFAMKAIAEELRGMAVEYDVALITATQANRGGNSNSDIEMSDTSESFGMPMTVDWMCAIIRTEEMDNMGQLLFKQLKSRYNDINYYRKFAVGIELPKFRLHNLEDPTSDLVDVGKTDNKGPNKNISSRLEEMDFT